MSEKYNWYNFTWDARKKVVTRLWLSKVDATNEHVHNSVFVWERGEDLAACAPDELAAWRLIQKWIAAGAPQVGTHWYPEKEQE